MDANKSPLSSFKSKDLKTRKVPDPDPSPWDVKTPGKPADPPRRLRNRGSALLIKDIREASMKQLRQHGSDPSTPIDPSVETKVEHVAKPKKSAAEIKLPEKYQLLDKFFSSLDSSIRLLQLKRTATSFTNISPQIETLTDRRFTYNHLAQLKFIMPEVIELEKVLRHDERTGCMKPDLRITLNAAAIENEGKSKSLSGNLQMRKVFRARLLNFFKSHPEGSEVPEEALPEPFSRSKNVISNSAQTSTSSLTSVTPDLASIERRPITLSQMAPSFKPRFAQRGSIHHIENSKQNQSVDLENKSCESPSKKEIGAKIVAKSCSKLSLNPSPVGMLSSPPVTPVKCLNSIKDDNQSSIGSISSLMTPVGPTTSTPSLCPPKRCYMSPDDHDSYRSPSKLVRRPPPNRPLKFDTPVKSSVKADDDIFDILPDSLVQSIQEKERLAAMEQDPSISQAKHRRKMIAGLPKRFDMIYYLFQSIRRSVVTKEELIQKIIFGDLKVSDRCEVEEQLRLLQELVPEWFYEKLTSSGDILLCVNKISSPEEIRTRLSEAK
ncbi:hypothetical protein CASFOL_008724 [Castilleja foliolosa]|uniref:CDT1 Geminin-binding domain-containing protein n=1 Tax=Castilleja foliolosa TaxID=1961234 RepID=A0ABD3E3W2_9LAMI